MSKKPAGTAIILAGGDSKRFGYPKTLLKLGDKTVTEIIVCRLRAVFEELIIVTDQPGSLKHLPVKITGDIITGGPKSSLRGLHAGLSVSSNNCNFVVACDMPFVNIPLVEYLYSFFQGNDAVVPRIDEYVQPLHAFYGKNCVTKIENNLINGRLKVSELFNDIKIRYVDKENIFRFDPEQKAFFNINTFADYEKARHYYIKEQNQKVI